MFLRANLELDEILIGRPCDRVGSCLELLGVDPSIRFRLAELLHHALCGEPPVGRGLLLGEAERCGRLFDRLDRVVAGPIHEPGEEYVLFATY